MPTTFLSVSISAENLLIFLTMPKFQLIDFSNLNFSISLVHSLSLLFFAIGPRQPFLLS